MRPILLIACALFLGFMALSEADALTQTYAAAAAAGSLLLSLK